MLHGHDADKFEKESLTPANYRCCRRPGPDAGRYKFLCCNFDDKIFPSFPAEKNVPRFRVKVIKQQQQHIRMGQELFLLLFPLSSAEAFNRNFNSCSSTTLKKRQKSHRINNLYATNKKFSRQLPVVPHCWKIIYNLWL